MHVASVGFVDEFVDMNDISVEWTACADQFDLSGSNGVLFESGMKSTSAVIWPSKRSQSRR